MKGQEVAMRTLSARRRLARASSAALAASASAVLLGGASAAEDALTFADPSLVRLLTVGAVLTEDEATGATVLDGIVADFEAQTGYEVVVTQGDIDIFDQARFGGADIVMAHLGFTPLHDFAVKRIGEWPATIMSNSVAFLVPPGDPAGVASATDPYEAFEAIAALQAPFVVNNLGETLYVTDVLYEAAGRPDPGNWFIDLGQSGPPAVRAAAQRGGYTLWGLHPFLMLQRSPQPVALEPVVFDDSILQRILATVVVRRPFFLVNEEGASAFQEHLTHPASQARIRAFRVSGIDSPIFWPAANQNDN
jgi:tungstate transport system substrate-binding protein